jgi:SAM-dependent methyltransferase
MKNKLSDFTVRVGMYGNGYTFPEVQDMSLYYPAGYWHAPGFAGTVKRRIFAWCQRRRVRWVTALVPHGEILDVGAGSGTFGKALGGKYTVTNFEAPFARVSGDSVIKGNFVDWQPRRKFEAVVFWESLEHMDNPQSVLRHAYTLVAPGGYIFVEYPRWQSLESIIFGRYWFHLDFPRHRTHFTDHGIRSLCKINGFTVSVQKNVWAPEYAPAGFAMSVLNRLHLSADNVRWGRGNIPAVIVLSFITMLAIPVECIFFLTGQSPIGLVVGKK